MNADAVSLGAGPDLRPRTADGWGLGATMALGVHLILVAALALGVRWKISTPETVEAEVWASIPKAAAPDAAPPPVAQPPQPVAPPPEAPAEPPPKAAEPEPIPDLVVRSKPKKEKKHKTREPVEVFDTTPPKPVKKVEKKPPEPVKTPPAPAKPAVPPSKASAPDNAKAIAEREALRKERLQNMMSELGSLGTPSRSAGPSASYAGRIRARIKPNIVFTDDVSGNPLAVVEVRTGPDGRILSRKLIEKSGVASWDEAVLRAIDRTEVLPADESGRVPSAMQLEFRPKDF